MFAGCYFTSFPVGAGSGGGGRSSNLRHNIIQTEAVGKMVLSDWLGHVGLRLQNLLRRLCVLLLGRLGLTDFLLL